MHTTSTHLLTAAFSPALKRATTNNLPPAFLLPSLLAYPRTSFSTTPSPKARKDGNPRRGVSALHRRGPKHVEKLKELISHIPKAELPSLLRPGSENLPQDSKIKFLTPAQQRKKLDAAIAASLPQPTRDPEKRSKVTVDPDHGLWEFFNEERTGLSTPLELSNHGRGWTVSELRSKDWEDLWRLWWVCLKERNRLETFKIEKGRITKDGDMYGDHEREQREEAIEKTMASIKHTLTERWYAWDNARQAAMEDEEVNLYAKADKGESAYRPKEPELESLLNADSQISDGAASTYTPPPPMASGRSEARV